MNWYPVGCYIVLFLAASLGGLAGFITWMGLEFVLEDRHD